MFKYPLVVTIDTNIFDAAKYNLSDASTLRILENHVKSGKIKVVLSDIVVQESKRHIAARVKEVCGIVNIARNSALKVYNEHLISSIGMNEMFRIVESEDDIIAKEEKVFDDFLCAIDAEILGTDLIDNLLPLRIQKSAMTNSMWLLFSFKNLLFTSSAG